MDRKLSVSRSTRARRLLNRASLAARAAWPVKVWNFCPKDIILEIKYQSERAYGTMEAGV